MPAAARSAAKLAASSGAMRPLIFEGSRRPSSLPFSRRSRAHLMSWYISSAISFAPLKMNRTTSSSDAIRYLLALGDSATTSHPASVTVYPFSNCAPFSA